LAVRQIDTTVVRSTPHFSAASRWVACWVRTCTNTSYFSDGASRLRGFGPGFGGDTQNLLNGDQLIPSSGWVFKPDTGAKTQARKETTVGCVG
jgi:hypothetical protein